MSKTAERHTGSVDHRRMQIVGLAAAGLFLICGTAVAIDSSWLRQFDDSLLLAARTPSDHAGPRWLTHLARDLTALGGYIVLTLTSVSVWMYLRLERSRSHASWFAATAAGGYALNYFLKLAVERPRPDLVTHLAFVDSPSFPSGHAMMSTVVFLAMGLMIRESTAHRSARTLAVSFPVVLAATVSLTRVYLGVHYPSDVIAGFCCGIAWTSGCWIFWPEHRQPLQTPEFAEARRAA